MASLISGLALASPAAALQPLEQFVASAQTANVDAIEAQATLAQRTGESRQAWAKLAPSVTARGTYTRNEPSVPPIEVPNGQVDAMGNPVLEKVIVIRTNQLDASVSATLPLIDVGSWMRISSAGATADAAKLRAGATGLEITKTVGRNYFQVVAADASIGAARRALASSQQNAKVVADRLGAGTASELDLQRARAEAERARQTLAAAEGSYATARRALETASGITPEDDGMPSLDSGLADEPPFQSLESGVGGLPSVRAAALETRAAEKTANAAWAGLAPTLSATATERYTNASGFTGQTTAFALAIQAVWTLDASVYFAAKGQEAQRAVAAARERRTVLGARDDLFNACQQVRTQIATAKAAKAQLDASKKAASLVRERYAVGSATQLEVTQADRDTLSAEMSVIQAQADLAYARMLVKLDSGRGVPGGAK